MPPRIRIHAHAVLIAVCLLVARPAAALPEGVLEVTSAQRSVHVSHAYYDYDDNLQSWSAGESTQELGPWNVALRRTATGEPTTAEHPSYFVSMYSNAEATALEAEGEAWGSGSGTSTQDAYVRYAVTFSVLEAGSFRFEAFAENFEYASVGLSIVGSGESLAGWTSYEGPPVDSSETVELEAGQDYSLGLEAVMGYRYGRMAYRVALVPEPATGALAMLGLLGSVLAGRRGSRARGPGAG